MIVSLMTGLTSALETRRPLVLLLHGWYTGDRTRYDYWLPLVDFLDAAQGRVTYVNATELVNLAPKGKTADGVTIRSLNKAG